MEEKITLKDYASYRKLNVCLTPEQIAELRKEIKELVELFCECSKKAYTKGVALSYSKIEQIHGFALFLLDFQGFHDQAFAEILPQLRTFTHFILAYDIPFAEAEYRLLEICQALDIARYRPERENVAEYILRNFKFYSKGMLRDIYERLKGEKITSQAVSMLYKLCRKEMPLWKRF